MENTQILIVEDDIDINNLLKQILTKNNYNTLQAFSGTEAKLLLSMQSFQLILLDLSLPGMTGEELIPYIRQDMHLDIPIIVISAKVALENKVNTITQGADDYMTKPFEAEEVLVRIHAALRRYKHELPPQSPTIATTYSFKDLSLNTASRKVTLQQQELNLTNYEYEILLLLMQEPEKVHSRDNLYQKIWQQGYYGEDNTINMHVSNIRKKIALIDNQANYIKTIWGIGFKLCE